MLRKPWLAIAVSCSALGCGGALQKDDASPTDGGTKSTLAAPDSSLVPATPFGSWELVSLDGTMDGNASTLSSGQLVLALRADGTAIATQCTRPYYEPGEGIFRCVDPSSYECLYGTITKGADGWTVDIPDLHAPTLPDRGLIIPDANDTLVIRYILPKYSAGHFVRATDLPAAHVTCLSP